MIALYVASVGPYSGKSLASLVIALRLRAEGRAATYFKPLGSLPVVADGEITDEDALFVSRTLGIQAPTSCLCPVLYTEELVHQAYAGKVEGLAERVRACFAAVSAGQEVVIIGGLGDLARGSLVGLSARELADLLDARVLVLAKHEGEATIEDLLFAAGHLGKRLAGVAFNYVPETAMGHLRECVVPYLTTRGIPVLGLIPDDEVLRAVTVRQLAQGLSARVLCCENRLDELVRYFTVGAMDVASAARRFREREDKAVITGGDRSDIQLAALQTATKAIVLTGNIHPSPVIVRRAQQVGVPLLLAPKDTLRTVEEIERIVALLRVREEVKVQRARELFEEHFDFARLYSILDLPPVREEGTGKREQGSEES